MQTHNPTTDSIRRAAQRAREGLPQLDPQDLRSSRSSVSIAIDWTRNAYKSVRNRPDLQQRLERAGSELRALQELLAKEVAAQPGRAH